MSLEQSAQGYVAVGDRALVGDNIGYASMGDGSTHMMGMYNDAGEYTDTGIIVHSESIVWKLQDDDPTVDWK